MNVIIKINGREAIPVRAIPLLTDWGITPLTLASILAETEPLIRMRAVHAYYVSGDCLPVRVYPKSWDCIEADIDALTEKHRALETTPNERYSIWRRDSIVALPAGMFVWKDEFETEWGSLVGYSVPARPGDHALNFSPFIDPALAEIVMDGIVTSDVDAATPAPVVPDQTVTTASDAPAKRNRKPSWAVVAMPYMKSLFSAGKFKSSTVFFEALKRRADTPDSPFKLVNRELYCTEAGTTVSSGTLGNAWPEIRAQ